MKEKLTILRKQFDKMPIFGQLREIDKRLTFGQYLTVLKEWFDKTAKVFSEFELCVEDKEKHE